MNKCRALVALAFSDSPSTVAGPLSHISVSAGAEQNKRTGEGALSGISTKEVGGTGAERGQTRGRLANSRN